MKRLQLLTLLLILTVTVLMTESCKKNDSCPTTNCNTGTLNDKTCACDCPTGYIGTNCESIDTAQIQALLDAGITPKALFDEGISLDQLYGKMYQGGLIFYLNTTDGNGMVAAPVDQSIVAQWGCYNTDIMNLNNVPWNNGVPEGSGAEIGDGKANTDAILAGCMTNGIAAKLCRDKGANWYLPSIKELNLMYTNLHEKDHGGFPGGIYWSSTEDGATGAWIQYFSDGFQTGDVKYDTGRVRAARAF